MKTRRREQVILGGALLLVAMLACSLPGNAAPPTVTPLVIPTSAQGAGDAAGATQAPLATLTLIGDGQIATTTLVYTPTNMPLPTISLPTGSDETPTAEGTAFDSGTPLSILSVEFTGWRRTNEQGGAAVTLTVHTVGGNGQYTYYHDEQAQLGAVFEVRGLACQPFVHTITVRSGDGQEARLEYFKGPEAQTYDGLPCQ